MNTIKEWSSLETIFSSTRDFISKQRLFIMLLWAIIWCLTVFWFSTLFKWVDIETTTTQLMNIYAGWISWTEINTADIDAALAPIIQNFNQNGILIWMIFFLLTIWSTMISMILWYSYFESQSVQPQTDIYTKITNSLQQIIPYFFTNILMWIFIALWFMLFIIPGIILMIYLFFTRFVMIKDKIYFLSAMKKSYQIVTSRRRQTLWMTIIISIIISVAWNLATLGIGSLINLIPDTTVIMWLRQILTSIIWLFLSIIMYAFYLRRDQTTTIIETVERE